MLEGLTVNLDTATVNLNNISLFHEHCYIDGAWVEATGGGTIEVNNPADGSILGTVPAMGKDDTRRAIAAADAAWPAWRAMTGKERAVIMRKWFDLMMQNQEDLAVLMTREQGKPLAESRGEIAYAASFIEWFAEEAKRVYGDVIPHPLHGKRIIVLKQPIGVVASITPWNFPAAMITRKCGPALAAGCTVVCKPASQTPYTALALAELAARAGIPKGVFNVITGPASEIGAELTSNPTVRKLGFTGSTEVGKQLMAQCAGTVKKVSFELGGNAPFIVFDDADLEAAVAGAMASKYRNTGQTCVCANRFLVQDGVYDAFAQRLADAVGKLKVGSGLTEGVQQGPLIDMRALEKVEFHIADATQKGARVVAGGSRHALGGTFFEPTVLANVTADMAVANEETFGPVAPLFRFRDEGEAIEMANDTAFGLAAYFYSRDVGRVWRVAEALEHGIIGINEGIISNEVAPFGGMKESGIGREGSKYGMDEFLEIKYLCMGGIGK
ncbi:MAG: NADP-dependent succinate-semialdehyde dehydrogenase [Nitrospira sp.]|jgi:succinate-semialdehyde dehydrogenase/glutarate-semialdehyde dehydrogenase|nr:NADP-dependent succinate-semialdehyde dehydrogenase [Nitrospira sp.]